MKKENRTVEYYVTMGFHKLVQAAAALIFLVCFLYAGYALWDTFLVLREPEVLKEELAEYRPESLEKLEYSFSQLMDRNPDICAWLTIDNTGIDYPVVQGADNFEYLNKNVLGDTAMAGSIYLDCQNSRKFTEFYSVLMGHHMQGGKMFGDVELFAKEKFFQKNRTGTLYLPDRILELETVAILSADAYNQILYRVDWDSAEEKRQLLDCITETALFTGGELLTGEDRLIALSTCSAEYTNARYLLVCRVVRESYATVNHHSLLRYRFSTAPSRP